ncbi:ATP-binding protein [Deferribacter thermophilus]|uniref:PAS domain-containing sensor histidine kinase n=1 Tax=Deferribacter thermophilus TaxID=53573 RepID=UPI003C268C20
MSKLREKAEELLSRLNYEDLKSELLKKDVSELIHEILVYQKELEIQNEELKAKQIELEEAKNKYFELYDNAPAGYITLDDKGIILEYNSTFLDIVETNYIKTGFATFFDFLDENDKEKFRAIYKSYFNNPIQAGLELKLRTKKPKYVRISGKVTLLSDDSKGLWLTVNDITESYLANLKIKTYLDIIENAQVAIIITNKENKIEYVNNYFETFYEYSKEEVIGLNPRFLSSGQTPQSTYKEMWENLSIGKSWSGIFINKSKSGKIYHIDSYITPILDKNKNIINFIAVEVDITSQIELLKKEIENKRLKSLVQLTGGIAHNINNFLMPILASTEFLKLKINDKSLLKNIKMMSDSAEKIASLVEKLLKYSNNFWLFKKKTTFSLFLTMTISHFKNITDNKITFEIDDKTKDIMLDIDIELIREAITNILKNSLQAIRKKENTDIFGYKGKIIFKAYLDNDKNMLKISIIDNGIGIPPEILDKVFEPFFTTEDMAKTQGLGLSAAKGIIESHGGFIEIHSTQGEGTTVDIYLPLSCGG